MLDDRTAPMENPQPDRRPIEEIIREVMDDPREAPPTPIPAEETPVEEAPVEEALAEEAPTEEAPVEEAPAAEAPTEEAAPEETPAEEAAEEPSPAPAENQKKKLPKGWLIALLVLTVLAAGIAALCVAAGSGDTVYAGVSVLGVDMGGMTPREAQAAWTDRSPAAYRAHSVAITVDEQPVASPSLAELGVSLTAEEAAQAALRACRSGNFLRDGYYLAYSWFAPREVLPVAFRVDRDALEAAVDAAIDGLDFTVIDGAFSLEKEGPEGPGLYITCPRDGKLIDEEKLLADLAEKLAAGDFTPVACGYTEKTAAGIDVQQYYTENRGKAVGAIYDRETGKPTRSHVGLEMDAAAVEAQLAAAAPGETFLAEAQVEFPKVSTEELETCMFRDVLGTVTTKVSGSSSRIGNVKLSAKCIDGRVYNPGEEFWYNKTVGRRTVERGFGQAPAQGTGVFMVALYAGHIQAHIIGSGNGGKGQDRPLQYALGTALLNGLADHAALHCLLQAGGIHPRNAEHQRGDHALVGIGHAGRAAHGAHHGGIAGGIHRIKAFQRKAFAAAAHLQHTFGVGFLCVIHGAAVKQVCACLHGQLLKHQL